MKKQLLGLVSSLLCLIGTAAPTQPHNSGYPIGQVPFTAVKVAPDDFWGHRLKASRDVTIPLAFSKCEETGRYDNFVKAAHPSDTIKVGGLAFDDTDVYKTIEGASYLMQTYPDPVLDAYIDSVLVIVAAAQEPDGYLYTSRTMNPKHPHEWAGANRWDSVEDLSHEFYDLGHMVDGAVAHYQATGKRNFLDIAIKYADCVCREIGPDTIHGQKIRVPGHQIAEMALCRLYLATGDKKYLDQAKFFLDQRGKTSRTDAYSQAHLPVVEQDEAVGHAVRAAYMYAGMADVAALTGDTAYIHAIDRIWDNIVGKKLYITGGIGATSNGEAFGKNYELPNMSAYCETCAAIGNVYDNYRMFLLHGDSKYYDVLERTLYNGLISGVSMDGGAFFYPNPLESIGQHQRQPWFGCACCPSNIARFIPSLPGYVYAVDGRNVYVNLYTSNTANLDVEGRDVELTQHTRYPYSGDVAVTIDRNKVKGGDFTLKLRIPGWVRNQPVPSDLYTYSDLQRPGYTVSVNGQPVEASLDKGYFSITRQWKKGDQVDVHFDMPVRTVKANSKVAADRGRVAVERGPLVYCAEWPDNQGVDVLGVIVNQQPQFEVKEQPELLNGVVTLTTDAQTLGYDQAGRLTAEDVRLTMIPYYAWNHRGPGRMAVWLPQDLSATSPTRPATIASRSKVTTSHPTSALSAVNDRLIPSESASIPYFHFWPEEGGTQWIEYEFQQPATVQQSLIDWYDDTPWGGCQIPDSYSLSYRDKDGQWHPVTYPYDAANPGSNPCPIVKGQTSRAQFEPVEAAAFRLEIHQPSGKSTGLYEWSLQ